MDLITLIATCAPMGAPTMMKAIVLEESRGHPYAIHDGKTHRAIFPATRDEATATVRRLIAAGHRIDAGLAQINSENWSWLGLTPETVFDPCTNLAAGERVLIDAYARAPFTVDAAISRYNSGDAERGIRNGYVSRVKAWIAKPQPERRYQIEAVPLDGYTLDEPVVVSVNVAQSLLAKDPVMDHPEPKPESAPALAQETPKSSAKPWRFEAVLDGFGGG
ncbi:MAG: lytic transglycosylase domain-containing protein [Lamprobacter sp.]|uniref:lytic transglycosylase domain-containing protein n=1 Tax=Lamprobacter sp. TaxID=3100796 RepID=UPI002B2605D7|nr:lytic transglycosylase domain-containing protein [Lamprobacter sp.]MEA3641959.1 lytic transglycosylase domain-containing protein [Lamprobacter sp.]